MNRAVCSQLRSPEFRGVRLSVKSWRIRLQGMGPPGPHAAPPLLGMPAQRTLRELVQRFRHRIRVGVHASSQTGRSRGECTVQPGVGKTKVRCFNNGERRRMLAAKFAEVPIERRYVFVATVDQERTRMYYRLTNDKDHKMGEFPTILRKNRRYE